MTFFTPTNTVRDTVGYPEWMEKNCGLEETYPPGMKTEGLDPYKFVEHLSTVLSPDDVIVTDTGCSLVG